MRTVIALLAVMLSATGCLTDEEPESEVTSSLSLTPSLSAPELEVAARIANARYVADKLRGLATGMKPPVNPTWTTYQKYRGFVAYLDESATTVDAAADLTYEEAMAMRDALKDEKDVIAEQTQQEMLQLQQIMEKKNQLASQTCGTFCSSASTEAEKLFALLR